MKKGKSIEQIKQQRNRIRARMRIVYMVLALVLAVIAVYLLVTKYFIVNSVTVSDSIYYTKEDLINTSGIMPGESMFKYNSGEIENRLYTLHPYISKVDVKKKFPSNIEITLEEQDGVMYIPVLRERYDLNSDLKVLGKSKTADNKIELRTNKIERCIVGEQVMLEDSHDKELIKEIYSSLCGIGAEKEISYMDIRDRFNIIINYQNRFEVFLGDDELLDYKIRILEKVIVDFPNDSGTITINNSGRAVINLDD